MGWLRSKLFHPTHHRCLPQIFIHDPTVHALQKHSKNINEKQKMSIFQWENDNQHWSTMGFRWILGAHIFRQTNYSKSRHINLRRRNRASVWRSRQYFCSTISERPASGIHTPRKPMAKIGPKRAKLTVLRVKHVILSSWIIMPADRICIEISG